MKVFCIIPVWNEEKNIVKIINDLKDLTDLTDPSIDEIVVVDDNSNDNTYNLVKNKGVTVLRHIINRDQGAALATGNEYALQNNADIVIHFDGDGQFLVSDIRRALKPIFANEVDVVYGSRFLGKENNIPRLKKNILFPIARMVNYFLLGIKMTDPQSGFRVMNKKALKLIDINQRGKAHCSEILYKVFKNNLRVKEVPITVIYNHFGQNFFGGVKIVKDLLISKLIG
ncbi:glycosyltransferase family 2 protein [Candidatus Parcubacteria bacterium]|nr:glycosyltransferase family 2 protein [Candidatus Parcubacteria bacterium]